MILILILGSFTLGLDSPEWKEGRIRASNKWTVGFFRCLLQVNNLKEEENVNTCMVRHIPVHRVGHMKKCVNDIFCCLLSSTPHDN